MAEACEVWHLGRVPYSDALTLQNRAVEARSRDAIPDQLLLLEHPHTYTLGSSGHDEYLLMPPEELQRRGVEVFNADRGGDITYHGPGQIVGYPIVRLGRDVGGVRAGVVDYLRKVEQVVIDTLAAYGIAGKRIPGLAGVWVDAPEGEAKICAVGVHVNVRAVTKHGFALNVNTDLSYFEGIVPCGIADKGVTSMAQMLGQPVDAGAVASEIVAQFGAVFDRTMHQHSETEPFPIY